MSRDDSSSSRAERAEKLALDSLRLNRINSIDQVGFPPFEGTLSIVISPKKNRGKEKTRLSVWQEDDSDTDLGISPPSVNKESPIGEHSTGAYPTCAIHASIPYPTSGLPALDFEQLECSSQSGGDTLEECQQVVQTIVTACLKQVGEHLSKRSGDSTLLLSKTATYPFDDHHLLGEMSGAAPALANPALAAQLSITLRVGQEANKPISFVPYSKFYGELGSDLDRHVSEFLLQCNANNARTDTHWHSIFSTTFEGHAKLWFYRQPLGSFPTWDSLREAFVAHFRPIGYEDRLIEQLADITMALGEAIDSYYGRMEDIILRLPANYGFNDRHIRNIFVRGLVPQRLKAFVKLDLLVDLAGTIQRAKQWEAAYVEDQLDLPIKPIFPNRTLAHLLAYPSPTYMPHPALATATVPATVVPSPQIIPEESLTPEMQVMANKINDLTSQ